jgi:hypothetical protein
VQKALHFVLYAALVVLWMWTLEAIGSRAIRALLSVTIAIGLGAVLEWCQLSVPGRFGSFTDVLLNSSGAIAGLLLALLLLQAAMASFPGANDGLQSPTSRGHAFPVPARRPSLSTHSIVFALMFEKRLSTPRLFTAVTANS